MKITLELYGASRQFSKKSFLEFNLKKKSSIKELRREIINYIDKSFKGNSSYKRIIKASAFCSEKDIFLNENYKIIRSQKISIIPPIGGG